MSLHDHSDAPRPRSAKPLLLAAAAALLLLVAAAGAWWWLGGSDEPAPAAPEPAPATAPGETARTTSLEVTANVSGAQVSLDGRPLGSAPQQVEDLASGSHVVRVDKPGFLPYERRIHLVPGLLSKVEAKLVREPKRFRVDSDVPGASVFIDREFVGKTPHVISGLSSGTHRLNVSLEGYEMYVQALEVEAGADLPDILVRFKEVRLDEVLAVVHKHGIGSCEGQLFATPAGLRYEPSKGKHRFEVPLEQLERFEVDYLKKNLKVKVKGGKTYNFTDRSPNADALLIFQRAVERARQAQ